MKRSVILALVFAAGIGTSMAQNEKNTWGMKGGVNFPMSGFSFNEAGSNINAIFTEEQRATGWHAGLFGRLYIGNQFYFGSNLLYLHSTSDIYAKSDGQELFTKTINRSGGLMDVTAGVEMFNFLRVQGGVNGRLYANDSWNDTFDTFGTGYTFGAGVDIWRFTVDLNYYGSFKEHQGTWQGVPLSYSQSDFLVSLGFKF